MSHSVEADYSLFFYTCILRLLAEPNDLIHDRDDRSDQTDHSSNKHKSFHTVPPPFLNLRFVLVEVATVFVNP